MSPKSEPDFGNWSMETVCDT